MNRQLRRAQAKLDEKAAKEKDRKRQERRARLAALRAQRGARSTKSGAKAAAKAGGEAAPDLKTVNVKSLTPEQRKRLPGRFSGALMIATVFFIVLQAAVPPPRAPSERASRAPASTSCSVTSPCCSSSAKGAATP